MTPRVDIVLDQHLTTDFLQQRLDAGRVEAFEKVKLLVDCEKMDGYERDARSLFVDWMRMHRERFEKVAIVTDNPMYRIVIATMSLATALSIKAFDTPGEAGDWLEH